MSSAAVSDASQKAAKDKSAGRIDGAVALAMLAGVAPLEEPRFNHRSMVG